MYRQNGFAHIGLAVLFVLVAVIGGAGWYVYQNGQVNDPIPEIEPAREAKTTETATNTKEIKENGELASYTDTTWGYSFQYPKSWRLETKDGDTTVYSPDQKYVVNGISEFAVESGATVKIAMNARKSDSRTVQNLTDFEYRDIAGLISSTPIKIAGYDGLEIVRNVEGGNWQTTAYFLYRQQSYVSVFYAHYYTDIGVYDSAYKTIRDSLTIVQ